MTKLFLASLIALVSTSAFAAAWQCDGLLTMAPARNGLETGVVLYLSNVAGATPNTYNPVAGNEKVADFIAANSEEKAVCYKGSALKGSSLTPDYLIYDIKLK